MSIWIAISMNVNFNYLNLHDIQKLELTTKEVN